MMDSVCENFSRGELKMAPYLAWGMAPKRNPDGLGFASYFFGGVTSRKQQCGMMLGLRVRELLCHIVQNLVMISTL